MQCKQNGFSLVEVIVASAIMSGMALFMFDMNSNMQKMAKNMEERINILQTGQELETFLASKKICTDSFKGLNLNDDEIIIRSENRDAAGNLTGEYSEKYRANLQAQDLTKNVSQLTLSHLEFENINLPENGSGKFYISYQFRKTQGSPFSKKYKFIIHARSTDGKIDECFSTPEEVIKAVTENVCQSLGGYYSEDRCQQIDGINFRDGSIPVQAISAKGLFGTIEK